MASEQTAESNASSAARGIRAASLLLASAMLCAGTVFVYAMLAPSLAPGNMQAGDDAIHAALTLESSQMLADHRGALGWSYMYGFGAPIYIFRPPGFYLTVQLLHALTLRIVPILTVHKFAYLLAQTLYPAALFYMLRKFRFPLLVCGIAACLAVTPISTWGHTIDAYYDLGLAKQAFAILLFPLVLGKFHGIIAHRERILPGALLFGLMFLNHPYMGLAFLLICSVYVAVELLSEFDWRVWGRVIGKTALMITGGLLLIAFWLVPFYTSDEIQRTSDYSSSSRHTFPVITETAAAITDHYLRGSLFDCSGKQGDVFGKDSPWKWRNNSAHPRRPVLSYMSIVGGLALLVGFRCRKNVFFATAWLASLIIFMGPDDIPLLRLIPFQSQFQYIHFIPIPELFVVSLASFGIYVCAMLVWSPLAWALHRVQAGAWQTGGVFALVAALVCAPFIFETCSERYAYSQGKTGNRVFEVGINGQTPWSLRTASNQSLKSATDYLRQRLDPFERFYGSPTQLQAGVEILHFTLMPAYLQRTDLISPLYGGLLGGVNAIVHSVEFRRHIWKRPILMDLFHVGALMTSTGNLPNYPFDGVYFSRKEQFPTWTIYDAEHKSLSFGATVAKPILCLANAQEWEDICASWLHHIQGRKREDLQQLPFLVWERASRRSQRAPMPLDAFAAIYVAKSRLDTKKRFCDGELERFRAARPVVCLLSSPEGSSPPWSSHSISKAKDFPFAILDGRATGSVRLEDVKETYGVHTVTVDAPAATFLYFKQAFYRGWRVRVDGQRVANVAVSPGFNGCRLEAGKHTVEFTYCGLNNETTGVSLSLLALAAFVTPIGYAWVKQRRQRQQRSTGAPEADNAPLADTTAQTPDTLPGMQDVGGASPVRRGRKGRR